MEFRKDGSKVLPAPWSTISFDVTNDDFVIQQFTGLIDKNNKEIYEGDLVNFTLLGRPHGDEDEFIENAEVWYNPEMAMFVFGRYMMPEYLEYSFCLADNIDKKSFEVVGNIFENKI